MRKVFFGLFLAVFLVLTVSLVSAAIDVTDTFDKDAPTFGSDNQKASNPDEDEERYDTSTVTISSDANVDITGITVTELSEFSGKLEIEAQNLPLTISTGSTGDLELKARIPENLDAVNVDLENVAFKVATVTVTADDASTTTFDVYMQRENNLEIADLDATYDGKTESNLDDGDDMKEVKPGETITLDFEVENKYDEDEDLDINDVEFRVEISGDADIDEDEDLDDIAAEESEVGSITFDIDEDCDDGTYDMVVTAEGDDDYGAKHGQRFEIDFEVERKTHEIAITDLDLVPDSINCADDQLDLKVDILNRGKKDEEEVVITIKNTDLGIDEVYDDIELDQDDDFKRTFNLFIDTDDLKSGKYLISVKTYYNDDEFSDEEFATLTLTEDCGTAAFVENLDADLTVGQYSAEISAGDLVQVPVTVKNSGNVKSDYSVEVSGLTDWAELYPLSPLSLDVGQSTTLYLLINSKEDLGAGSYSGTVSVKSDAKVLDTKTVTVSIPEAEEEEAAGWVTGAAVSEWFSQKGSTVFWIIGDIVLIVVAIFFIRLIFVRPKK